MAEDKNKDALESFLSRDNNAAKEKNDKDPNKKTLSKKARIIIAGATALLVIAGIICLLVFLPKGSDKDENLPESAAISYSVNEKNEHQASVATDENGNIIQNGTGKLIEMNVDQIKEIDISNEGGNYTILCETPKETVEQSSSESENSEETSSTIYTIKGFEDMALQTGIPDSIANACVNIEFSSIVETDPDPKDFGLDEPRAKAVAKYEDGTTSVIYVGNDAPQQAGTYISFGSSKTVYLTDTETAGKLLTTINGLVSLEVTPTMTDSDNSKFERLTLSGTNFPEEIVLKPNDDEAINSSYIMISPTNRFTDESESTTITGGIRGLYAAEVIKVNPSEDDLSEYGLSKPYAQLEAVYPDTTIDLISSQPAENSVYLMHKGGNILYRVADTSVPWVSTDTQKLKSKTILDVNKDMLKSVTVEENNKSYTIDVTTTTEKVENEDGEENEVKTVKATYNKKELKEEDFLTFFQNYQALELEDFDTTSPSSSPVMTITFSYSNGRDDDTVAFDSGDTKSPVSLNGDPLGNTYSSRLEKFSAGLAELISGKTVTAI